MPSRFLRRSSAQRIAMPAALVALPLLMLLSVMGLASLPTEALAVTLPDNRAYEEVTPVYMNDARAIGYPGSEDGEKEFYRSPAGFAGESGGNPFGGIPYEARRTPTGWVNHPLAPSAKEHTYFGEHIAADISADDSSKLLIVLASPLVGGFTGDSAVAAVEGYFMQQPANSESLAPAAGPAGEQPVIAQSGLFAGEIGGKVGSGLSIYLGGSADLSHLIFESGVTSQIVESYEAGGSWHNRYVAVTDGGNPEASQDLLSTCTVNLGSAGRYGGEEQAHTMFHAVSEDGSIVFFTAEREPFGAPCYGPGVDEVYARVNGTQTIPISEPTSEYCPGLGPNLENFANFNFNCRAALFEGASKDGSRVFFTSSQAEEAPGVTDATNNVYEVDLTGTGTRSVAKRIQVSAGDTSGEGARVRGVVRISDDGSRVYFVAQGVLTNTQGPEGTTAQNGADNLYLYDEGTTKFIGELCSGLNTSGSLADPQCPSGSDEGLWNHVAKATIDFDEHPAWALPFGTSTSDGHIFLFQTYAQLITTGPQADTDTAIDVYEYDSQTGGLTRISTGHSGFDENGNNDAYDATIPTANYSSDGAYADGLQPQQDGGRPASNDGKYVFFSTSEALEPSDINNAPDVYEWHDGLVSLISDGEDPNTNLGTLDGAANRFVSASATGRDVFFQSPDVLVPGGGVSTDSIWDARIGGGFPVAGVPPVCREDACQGSIAATPSFPAPASATFSNSEGAPSNTAPIAKVKAKPKKSRKPSKKHKKPSKGHKKARKASIESVSLKGGH